MRRDFGGSGRRIIADGLERDPKLGIVLLLERRELFGKLRMLADRDEIDQVTAQEAAVNLASVRTDGPRTRRRLRYAADEPMRLRDEDLVREFDIHDELVVRCARGDLSYSEFEKAYDNFYPRYPLDGHESNAEQLQLLEKLAPRIALHREIWDEVLTKVTEDEFLVQPATVAAGFIGSKEAVRRIRGLAERHLKLRLE